MIMRLLRFSTLILILGSAAIASAEEPAAEQAPATEEAGTAGWFRVDTDSLGTQLWFGATHAAGGLDIASDIYLTGGFGELDIGPSLSFGQVLLTPMIGIGFDFPSANFSAVVPQLFTIVSAGAISFESWIQVFLYSPFADAVQDSFYTRNFALYKLSDELAIGPQIELTYGLNEEPGAFDTGVLSLPIGAALSLGYGKNNTLLLFLGYETEAAADSDAITGRFTFLRNW